MDSAESLFKMDQHTKWPTLSHTDTQGFVIYRVCVCARVRASAVDARVLDLGVI